MKLFSHACIILPVPDVLKTAEYYRDSLGFTITFIWGDPPSYVVVNREDAVGIHFSHSDELLATSRPRLFIFVNDADQVYDDFQKAGVKIVEPINNTDYQMREFVIEDLNGYKFVIGKGL